MLRPSVVKGKFVTQIRKYVVVAYFNLNRRMLNVV